MSHLIKSETIGNHRINIYNDESPTCPATDWDLCGIFLWETNDRYFHRLSQACNYKDVFGKYDDSNHSLCDALVKLIHDHVDWKDLLKYFKQGKVDGCTLIYDRSTREWILNNGHFCTQRFDACDIYSTDYTYEFCEDLEEDDLISILRDLATDIVIHEWSTTGYSQGDYVSGIAYCDKKRYDERCGRTDVDWKTAAMECMEDEAECIGMWMWGDVIGYTLEKKVEYTKVFKDESREPEEDCEWEEVHSCWDYFMEPDELIKEVTQEWKLSEAA